MRLWRRRKPTQPTWGIPLRLGNVVVVLEAWPVSKDIAGWTRIDFRPGAAVIRTDAAPWNREEGGA